MRNRMNMNATEHNQMFREASEQQFFILTH